MARLGGEADRALDVASYFSLMSVNHVVIEGQSRLAPISSCGRRVAICRRRA
jgi:hypothetical protein